MHAQRSGLEARRRNHAPTRLILLPGIGADGRLFRPQAEAFPALESPPLLSHADGETLADFARRFAPQITTTPPYALGGVSFGGMLALELATLLQPPPTAVFLIASARTGRAIAPHLHYFVEWAPLFPARTFRPGEGLSRLYADKWGALTAAQRAFLEEVLAAAQPAFVRWAIAAATTWPGALPAGIPVHHVHGSDDRFIPLAGVQPDVVIGGGGHLINVTHAAQVNIFLAERMS